MSKYESPKAIKTALKGRIEFERFVRERFLVRVFENPETSQWVLKGGMALLLRIPNARATRDLDFSIKGQTDLKNAIDELASAAAKPSPDLLEFALLQQAPLRGGDERHGRQGARLKFLPLFGGKPDNFLSIDIVLDPQPLFGEVEYGESLFGEDLGFHSSRPRLFPLADQIAEKACALHEVFAGNLSTRSKDFFDLAILASTKEIGGRELEEALLFESERRSLKLAEFRSDSPHEKKYLDLARDFPELPQRFDDAVALVNRFLDSAIVANNQRIWSPSEREWLGI